MAWEEVKKKKPVVAIMLPHRGSLNCEFLQEMWIPLAYKPVDFCDKLRFLCRVPSLPLARNILVSEMLKSKATHGLFIDSDLVMENPSDPNEALRRMLSLDLPIVTGLYRAKQTHGFNYAIWMKNPKGEKGFVHVTSWTGDLFPIDVCGAGFLLVKREVFESVEPPWFHWEMPGEVSEDFSFLLKAKEKGYETVCYSEIRLSHLGNIWVTTDGKFRVSRV